MSVNFDKFFTYMAASSAFTPGATPQDVFSISGNVRDNIYVLKMGLSTVQTTDGTNAWFLTKRSTPNTGGTSTLITPVSMQSGNTTSVAVLRQYTANPTTGTLVGNLWSGFVGAPKNTTVGVSGSTGIEINFETTLGQPLALLNANETLSWNFGGAALPAGLSVLAWVLWAESSKS